MPTCPGPMPSAVAFSRRRVGFPGVALLLLPVFLAANAPATPPDRDAVTPWTGDMGISETTGQIMERASQEYQRLPRKPWKTPKQRPRGRTNFENLLLDPLSPDPALAGNSDEPPTLSFAESLSFTGATLSDTLAFPPDSMGTVGPQQFIVAVNGRIRSFNKQTGAADGIININPDLFFASVMTPPLSENFTSDPRIRYDRLSGRWFIIIIDVPGAAGALPNRIMIAVSDSSIVTPSTVWTFFQFQHDLVAPQDNADTGKFADYPTLGIDAHALYIGVNVFGTRGTGSFANTTAFVVRKSSLLGAGPIVVTAFRKLISNSPQQGGPYTPQGVDNYDPNATEGYLIGVDSAFYGRLKLRRISNPGGNPSISENINITVPATGNTINVPHLGNNNGTSGYLDGLDYRLIAAHIRNGRLWTSANLAVNNVGSPGGTDTRMGIRWYELDGIATGQTPSVVQAGTLYQSSAANTTDQRSYWMGSIMVSGQGHAVLGFSAAGANEYINAGYARRLASDPPGTLGPPTLYTASVSSYNPPSNPGGSFGRRWGDYSYASLDPDDDMTMWTIQEWCHAPNSYAVQVIKIPAPPPATPAAAAPDLFNAGQSNVNVTVIGNVIDGSGFFDPGPGFSNRLAAVVEGGGVTVHSVFYSNPTNITLNLSVDAGATPGSRAITVINPDGQSATSTAGLLTISGAPITNQPPGLTAITNRAIPELAGHAFMADASDPDNDGLTFSLDPGFPPGAAINPVTGMFSWTPSEAQGPSTNSITVRVTDDGTPNLSATRTFTIVVVEVNSTPELASVADRVLHAGMALILTNDASDADLPANTLLFSLDPGSPSGMTVDPSSGVLTWTTSDSDIGANPVVVRVTDSGEPPLDATIVIQIQVFPRPLLQVTRPTPDTLGLAWSAIDGFHYRVEYTTNLVDPVWIELPGTIVGSDGAAILENIIPSDEQRFYRVRPAQP